MGFTDCPAHVVLYPETSDLYYHDVTEANRVGGLWSFVGDRPGDFMDRIVKLKFK